MDLIKKNWGFLVYAIICLVVGIVLIVQCVRAGKTLKEAKNQHQQEMAFFDSVKKANLKLSPENINRAEQNKKLAEEQFQAFLEQLKKQYRLQVNLPRDPIEAVRTLRDEITAIRRRLDEKGITYGQGASSFTFDYYAKLDTLPPVTDLPKIFRHLKLIKIVIENVIEAELLSIDAITRPLNMQIMQEDLYTYTPIEINVTGSLNNTQKFINQMNSNKNCLFFLRELELIAPDELTDVGATLKDALFGTGATGGMGMGIGGGGEDFEAMGMGMGMGMGGPQRPGGRQPGRQFQPAPDMMPGEAGPLVNRAAAGTMAGPPPKRQDLLVFMPKQVSWRIRFDMVDFNLETEE
ncbi:MAG TPA: Amuc_1100 family pilus-like protein [Lentisphaeria bacterium]|nr:Amuc_1100 family pilus-like protein [Lentisphaeria bacterium]